jgi:flagellin
MELNLRAANSRIMDADLASEQLTSAKLSILQQTATAQLAAANSAPASILALFR